MLQNKLIEKTIEKYSKLKGFDVEFNRLKADLVNFCVNYIKDLYPQEVFDYKTGGYVKKQGDIYFWSHSCVDGISDEKFTNAYEFFDIANIPLSAFNLPFLCDSYCFTDYKDDRRSKFRKDFSDFVKGFEERYIEMVKYATKCSKSLRILKKILKHPEATLTSIKNNYSELYTLIKS